MLLTQTTTPEDVKALNRAELPQLCDEIRHAILESSAAVGGHVAPNLGVVELTVALHRVFNSPIDKIVFDVSHQTYAHKALTGRAYTYIDPKRFGEASGFANPDESEHDLFAMGHTSTSVSLGCGLAHARDLAGDAYNVITIIGDGSLSGGLAFEGFNNAAELDSNLIIIVNDNDQSIAENHGGLYRNLAELRASNGTCERNVFRAMGLDYRYLDAGNDVLALVDALQELRNIDHPIVLHVSTAKGKGFEPAQNDPERWHHVGPFDMATGRKLCPGHPSEPAPRTYADITGEALSAAIERDSQVVGITAATPYIMGFTPELRAAAGKQFVDVGIAEEHAVTFATALARSGAKPVFGVYGTFLQRAYDELWHDLCLNDAPATILVFGASIFGTTSETHLSFFDISMLGGLPNMHYLAPACMEEYLSMLSWSLDHREHPVAIRVPAWLAAPIWRPPRTPTTAPFATTWCVRAATLPCSRLAISLNWASAWQTAWLPSTASRPRSSTHALQPSSTTSSSTALPPSIALSSPSRTASWTVAGASASRAICPARLCARAPSASPRASPTATTPTSCSLRTA